MEVRDLSGSHKREDFLERAADMLDLPGEVVAGMPRITITGGCRVLVENHRGILEYGQERITVNGGRMVLTVCGGGLEIRSLNTNELLITGRLRSMEFDC